MFNFRFKPYRSGVALVLGPREAEIMDLIWERDLVSVGDIHQALKEKRIAYTTVMTIMSRLAEKGLLRRTLVGNSYSYSAAVTREELANTVVKSVLDSLLKEFAEPALSYFLGRLAEGDKETLAQLEELIKKKRSSS